MILRLFSPNDYIVSHSETLIKSHAGHLPENLGRVLYNDSSPMTHWSRILPEYRKEQGQDGQQQKPRRLFHASSARR